MPRYIAMHRELQPGKSYIGDACWGTGRSSIEVIESVKGPRRTGLLDQDGNPLYRIPPHRPIGFTSKWSSDED